MKYFGRIDEMVEVIASLGVQKSVQDVNRKIVMTLACDYEEEKRTILHRKGVTRAEIESIVRLRYFGLPASKGKNEELLVVGRGKRRSNSRSRSRGGKVSSSSNPQALTQDSPSAFDKVEGKCIRFLEPGHHWNQCKARIAPAPEQLSGGGA